MSFDKDMQAFRVKLNQRLGDVFVNTVQGVHQSVVEGSPVTGAPGQPVDTGALRASWQIQFVGPQEALISTNMEYAPAIEEGYGPHGRMTLRSAVGGFNSVKLTRANWQRLVDSVAARVVR